MPLLTPADRAEFFPSVAIDGPQLHEAIAQAQAIAEGPEAANRPLELRLYVEEFPVRNGCCRWSYVPLLPDPKPKVEGRWLPRRQHFYYRDRTPTQWTALDNTQYEIDRDLQCVWVYAPVNQLRVSYFSGWDFARDRGDAANQIRALVGRLLAFSVRAGSAADGVRAYEAIGEYSVSYSTLMSESPLHRDYQHALEGLRVFQPRRSPV